MSVKNIGYILSFGLILSLYSGCGSSGSTGEDVKDKQTPADEQVDNPILDGVDNNKTDDNKTEVQKDTHAVGFTVEEDLLYDIRTDSTKLVWVNSTSDACYVYNSNERDEDIKVFGQNYCKNLDFKGITTWQLPAEKDAKYLMSNVGDKIIYPDAHPGCQFMISKNSSDYTHMVGTTNSANKGEVVEGQNQSGIRCVSILK